jgi:RNA polymerase sigma factor (sigma-70 family)
MGFPETRPTLIQRLSTGGSEKDWRDFLDDYWVPVCSFAMRWGCLSLQDAEDVAADLFQALNQSDLLARWQQNRAARLRTLLCSVVRNVISNRARVQKGRQRILQELADSDWSSPESSEEQVDIFYAAWVGDLLTRSVDRLLMDLHRDGKGDYFRVLYGRLCEELSIREVAKLLGIKPTTVENYYKAAKNRLAEVLESTVREYIERYCTETEVEDEFRNEWAQLSEYLGRHGGLENAVRARQHEIETKGEPSRKSHAFVQTQTQMRQDSSKNR